MIKEYNQIDVENEGKSEHTAVYCEKDDTDHLIYLNFQRFFSTS